MWCSLSVFTEEVRPCHGDFNTMDWSCESIIKFLELLESERSIWDPKDKYHKLRHKVNAAWIRISDSMDGMAIDDLKTKKKSLMSTFRPLLKKKRHSIRSGIGADSVFQPTWFAFDVMERFLGPILDGEETKYYEEDVFQQQSDSMAAASPQPDWTTDTIIQFLELLETERSIWHPKDKYYKHKQRVYEAWERISDNMGGISVEHLKSKKKSLMSSFRPLLKKKKISLSSGVDPDEVYQPTWFAFDIMERFLGPIFDVETIYMDEDMLHQSPSPSPSSIQFQWSDELATSPHRRDSQKTGNARKRHKTEEYFLEAAEKKVTESFETLSQVFGGRKEEDDCDVYAKLLAKKLRKYPERMRDEMMHRIDGLLLENPYPDDQPTRISSSESQPFYQNYSSTPACNIIFQFQNKSEEN